MLQITYKIMAKIEKYEIMFGRFIYPESVVEKITQKNYASNCLIVEL
jgi:hypothetical protein